VQSRPRVLRKRLEERREKQLVPSIGRSFT